jgi:hypothetical protein
MRSCLPEATIPVLLPGKLYVGVVQGWPLGYAGKENRQDRGSSHFQRIMANCMNIAAFGAKTRWHLPIQVHPHAGFRNENIPERT